MKKVAIIVRSLNTGGIEKSLINLLNYCEKENFKIDLFMFTKEGALTNQLSKNIKINIIPIKNKIFTLSQKEANKKSFLCGLKRAIYAVKSKIFTNKKYIRNILREIPNYVDYDNVISFQTTSSEHTLYFGPCEIALSKFPNAKKILFIHSDFMSSGLNNNYVLNLLSGFDKLVFVSKSCMENFKENVKQYELKACYCYNIQDLDAIISKSTMPSDTTFDKNYINLITVARLSQEKAHIRTLKILKQLKEDGYKFIYHIVGDGVERKNIEKFIIKNNMSEYVKMYGNQTNPYTFVKQADLFLLLSYHEAAPMVIEESYVLNVPVISTNTISAKEMICNEGFLCENNEISIYNKLKEIMDLYLGKTTNLNDGVGKCLDNKVKFKMFKSILD